MTGQSTLNLTVGQKEINLNVGANLNITIEPVQPVQTANYISTDGKFYFDGNNGTTYLMFNSSTSRLEMWVQGVKQAEWGTLADGNPFE